MGSDEKNQKATYVTYEGTDKAKADVERLSKEAVEKMNGLVVRNEFLTELLLSLIHREK